MTIANSQSLRSGAGSCSAIPPIPLTPLQQGMFFTWLQDPTAGVDVEQMICTLPEAIDAIRLKAAWEQTTARHTILRTTFSAEAQTVHAELPFPWREEDWTHSTPPDQEQQLSEWLEADRRAPLSLTDGPLQRFLLIRLGPSDFRLIWTFHHILIDGRAITALLRETFSVYDTKFLPLLRPEPAAHALWLQSLDHRASEFFWKQHLTGVTGATPLVVERLLPPGPNPACQEEVDHFLTSEVTSALRARAAAHDLTLNTFVQGAFALLLGRYASEDRVIFGATRACRHTPGLDSANIIGLLINTLPFCVELPAAQPLLAYLQTLRQHWLNVRPHEHTPLSFIRRSCGMSPSQVPFQHLLVFENDDYTGTLRAIGGPAFAKRSFHLRELTSVPLTIAVYGGTALRLHCAFQPATFDRATIQRLLGHLGALLEQFASESLSTPLSSFSLITPAERQLLLHDWQPPPPPPLAETTLTDWFTETVRRFPERIAVTSETTSWTYAQLDERATAIAHALIAAGVRPGNFVGICLERRTPLIAALLGILKAGAAYLPIDLAYPPERLAFMLKDASAPVLLTERPLAEKIPPNPAATIFIEDLPESAIAGGPLPTITPEHLAYLIYTSGSTGLPKGCQITHRNVVRLMRHTEPWYHFNEQDVWTLFHSTAFDFSVWELWGALLYGGRLVVVPWLTTRSPEDFFKLLCTENVTVLNQTPSAFRQLIPAETLARATSPNLPPHSLRYIIFGGEALEMQSLQPWFQRHGDTAPVLVNMYGITETTVHVTYRPLSAHDLTSGSVIGVPIPDLQLYVLDPVNRQPVPVGVPGEMYVGGPGLAAGYLQRPELTADRFLPNHLTNHGQLYRTGDLARFIPAVDSASLDLEYLGRIDHQVKIRGFRIELGEIENVLTAHPAIQEAAVLAREDRPGDKRLCAYLVLVGNEAPAAEELRSHLKTRMPEYMVPATFVYLEKFPITPNGKLDRKALPAPAADGPATNRPFQAPQTPQERTLVAIWEQVLRVERVSTNDNFFEIGGDSILSIQVITRARSQGLVLSPRQLFEHPTIAALAAVATPLLANRIESETDPSMPFPLTPIQRWFFEQNLPDSHHWNQAFLFTPSQPLDPVALRAALHQLLVQHPALRLRFHQEKDAWVPGLAPAETSDLLSVYPNLDQLETICAQLQTTLNYQTGPLLKAALFAGDEVQSSRLFIAVHHLAIDGVSWRILLEDLEALLTGNSLPAPTTPWPQWARAVMRPPTSHPHPYWKQFTTAPLRQGPPTRECDAFSRTVSLAVAETTALLHRAPTAYRTRSNDLLLTALALTTPAGLTLTLEGHGREESLAPNLPVDRTIGWFTAMFPVRLTLPSTDPALALPAIKEQLRVIPDHGAGYQLLNHPLPNDLVFNYLGQFDALLAESKLFRFAPESTGPWHAPAATRAHLTEINAMVIHGQLQATFTSAAPAHSPESLAEFADHFLTSLRALIAHCLGVVTPQSTPSDFPLAGLHGASLQTLLENRPHVDDICQLSPMQQLFYNAALTKPNAGFDQWHGRLHGPLDVSALQAAWTQVVERHSILRTTFHSAGLPHPVMMVHGNIPPNFKVIDAIGSEGVTEFLAADATTLNDLTQPLCGRFTLLRISENEHHFLWSVPDLQLDGWSWPIVFGEAATIYRALIKSETPALPAPRPYRDYLTWLSGNPDDASDTFWRSSLENFHAPTPLPLDRVVGPRSARRTANAHAILPAVAVAEITAAARQLGVTPGVMAQAAWAALLSHGCGLRDVVHGSAFSGRPAELPGAEFMVGPFINNLPVRTQVDPALPAQHFLRQVHAHLTDLTSHQFTPLTRIQDQSRVPWRHRLFDSILVFQNYQVDESLMQLGPATTMTDFQGPIHTNFPLALVITPGNSWQLLLVHQASACSAPRAAEILSAFSALVVSFAAKPHAPLSEHLAPLLIAPASAPAASELPSPASAHPAPRTPMEQRLASIWQRAFGLSAISTADNFFDLGGHSMLMLRVHAAICQELNRPIPVVTLFQYPTLATLAAFLDPQPTPTPALTSAIKDRAAAARAAAARAAAARR